MNKKEKEKYKKLLIKEKIRILEAMGALQKDSLELRRAEGENHGVPTHLAELASDNFEKNLDLNLTSSEGKLLAEINNALAKLVSGKSKQALFGICEKCQGKVSQKRLYALPYARFCIACQRNKEITG
ncbi:hypothetical protein GH153_05110 [bacterium]|nr:hypothetical protein [bacterium]